MTLKKFQDAFSLQLLHKKSEPDIPYITPSDQCTLQFKIYQNNVYSSLIDVLKDRYPKVNTLVGDEFFSVLCQHYISENPPNSPVMLHYGEPFPDFIQQHEDKHNIAFLSDVARIESAQHRAYYSQDNAHLSAETIASTPIEKLLESHVVMTPSLTLIESPFMVYTLWQHINSSNKTLNTNINQQENILIFKKDLGVQTLPLLSSYTYFLRLLLNKNTLGQALEKLIEFKSEESFEPTEAISFLIQNQLIKDII